MAKTKKELVKMLLKNSSIEVEDEEKLMEILVDEPMTIDVDKAEEAKMTIGDKIADKVSEVAGSWTFVIIFIVFLLLWIILNAYVLSEESRIDPYPFILLNLVLSCIAAIQAPIIMMSQNRQAAKDSIRNKNDFNTDLKSELILETLYDRVNEVLRNQRKIIKLLGEESSNEENKN